MIPDKQTQSHPSNQKAQGLKHPVTYILPIRALVLEEETCFLLLPFLHLLESASESKWPSFLMVLSFGLLLCIAMPSSES